MGTAARLGSSLEALAAVAAYLRVETEQLTVDPRVHDLLRAIAVEVLGEEPGVTRPQGAPVVGMARALLAMSAEERAREAVETGAETLAVACPFCTVMLDDGVRSAGAEIEVVDVATLLVQAVERGGRKPG